ncbi:MAG: hypothetical protein WA869_03690 [Alloacidobacterium sp.]
MPAERAAALAELVQIIPKMDEGRGHGRDHGLDELEMVVAHGGGQL